MTGSQEKGLNMDSTECFGQYKRSSKLCWKLCALKLGCAIEKNRMGHIEIMENLMTGDNLIIKI